MSITKYPKDNFKGMDSQEKIIDNAKNFSDPYQRNIGNQISEYDSDNISDKSTDCEDNNDSQLSEYDSDNISDNSTDYEDNNDDCNMEAIIKSTCMHKNLKNNILKCTVTDINKDFVSVYNPLLKSEAKIPLTEFFIKKEKDKIEVGSSIDLYTSAVDSESGKSVLSYETAIIVKTWKQMEKMFAEDQYVEGIPFSTVKGGLAVDINGVIAFLPGSQIDTSVVKNVSSIIGKKISFGMLTLDTSTKSVVVSRKTVLNAATEDDRKHFLKNIQEGDVIQGRVKNLTNYGAFVALYSNVPGSEGFDCGVDGLLHVSDLSWDKNYNHPSETLSVGQEVDVMIIKYEPESKRISLGIKQLQTNPWLKIADVYKVNDKVKCSVTNITEYGIFAKIIDPVFSADFEIEGLIHNNDISWSRDASKSSSVAIDDEIYASILEIDLNRHRIKLGIKQLQENPYKLFTEKHNTNDIIEGVISNVTDFGIFVNIAENIDGLVYACDISWSQDGHTSLSSYKKGDSIKVVCLEVDVESAKVRLGIKQLEKNPFMELEEKLQKNNIITCVVEKIKTDGIEVKVSDQLTAFIKKPLLAIEVSEQRPDRFVVGDRVDAKIINFEKSTQKLTLSIKALEEDQYKQTLEKYGSTNSGATIGAVFGQQIKDTIKDLGNLDSDIKTH